MSLQSFLPSRSKLTGANQRAWSGRIWWAGLVLILLLAGGLRLLSYDFSLPYIDHIDEPNKYLGALEWRGLYDGGSYYDGNPPAYIAVNLLTQVALEALGQPGLANAVRVLRLLSVAADLLAIVLIAMTARLVADSSLAGLIAAVSWALAPLVLENNAYALPDPLNTMLAALALWLAANAVLVERRGWWSILSVAAGLIATLLKYPAFPAVIPGGLAALILTIREPRKGERYLGIQVVLVAATLLWLFFIYGIPVGSLEREGATIRESGLTNIFDLTRVVHNLYFVFYPLDPAIFALFVVPGLARLLWATRHEAAARSQALVVAIFGIFILATPWLTAAYALVSANTRMRDVLPATVAATILLGLAVDQVTRLAVGRRRIGVWIAVLGVLAGFVYIPQFNADMNLVRQRRAPDLRVAMRQWFDANLDPGTVIVTDQNEKTFNPLWGGIPYHHWVDWWLSNDIMEHSLTEWRDDRGMSYAVLPLNQVEAMQTTDEGQAYLAGMLRLRDFTSATPVRGPEMIVYRLWRMAHETAIHFGDHITLTGYDLTTSTVSPGDQLALRLYWNASATPKDNYSAFIHLVPAADYTVLAQFDGLPAAPQRRMLTWDAPSETLISPWLPLTIPDDLSPGSYRVMVGLYNFETGVRLPVRDANGDEQGDVYRLATVQVTE